MGFFKKHISGFSAALAVVLCMFLSASSHEAQAQNLAVKTNALMWLGLTPNVGVEFVTGEHSSVEIAAFGHYKPYGLESKLIAVQPEYRYWFNGRPLTREYVGVTAMACIYDMHIGEYVYNGNAASLGITGGYVFNLTSRWNLELCGGFSFLFFNQKQYHENDNYDDYFVEDVVKTNAWGYKLFPAKLGVTFTYIIR